MSKENLLMIEEVLDAEKSKEDRQIILEGLKDQIKEFEKDADADFQKEIDRVKAKFGIGGAKKKPTPKPKAKTTKTPRAKTTPEQKAKNREKVQNATGKTIEECKEILAKYEALRGKTTQKDKQRVDKLKDEDKIIDGTNVKTADAITETTAKQVPKKIKQEVDAIEKEAEQEAKKEVNPKGKTKAEVKKEVEEVKIEKIEEKVKDMTKDLADKSNELIDAMTNTIKKLSPSKDEAIKFLMDIRNHIDVLLKANKFEFGGAVQSYNIAWMGGQPTPSYAKGGKFEDSGWIKSLPNAMGYEVEDVFEPMAKSSKDKFEFREKVRDWDIDGVLNKGKSGDEWIDRQYKRYSKGGKFADGGEVLMEISTHKAVRNGDKIDIISKGFEVDDLKIDDEKLYSIRYENKDDLLQIFDELEEENRINLNEDFYAKGGTTRKKGLGWKRDRQRISQEPHEQAYKSKRKGKYSSFEMGGDIENISDLYDSMEAGNYPYARDMVAYFIFGDKERGNIIFDAVNGRYTSERADESELSDIMIQYDNTWKDNMEQLDVETMESLGDLTEYYSNYAKGGKTWVQDVVDSPNFREDAFTRKAEARGMSTDAFMNQVLHSPNLYDERTRKQAQFMKNAFND